MLHAGCWAINYYASSHLPCVLYCCYYPHFTGEKMEAQRDKALVPRLRANWWSWGSPTATSVCFPLPHCFLCCIPPKCTNFLMKLRSNCFSNNLAVTVLAIPWAMGTWKWDRSYGLWKCREGGGEVCGAGSHQPSLLVGGQSEYDSPLAMLGAREDLEEQAVKNGFCH